MHYKYCVCREQVAVVPTTTGELFRFVRITLSGVQIGSRGHRNNSLNSSTRVNPDSDLVNGFVEGMRCGETHDVVPRSTLAILESDCDFSALARNLERLALF